MAARRVTDTLSLWHSPDHGQGHGYNCDPSKHIGVSGVAHVFGWPSRLRRGNKNKLVPIDFAPAAHIGITQINKVNWAIKFVLPILLDLRLTGVDLHQGIWRATGVRQTEAEELLRSLAQRFGGDPAATDSTRVFRLPGFNNKKYKENFLVELATGTLPEPVYHRSDFRIEILPGEHGTTVRKPVSAQAVGSEAVNTQSERDWAYAIRHLRHGDNPELIIRKIAAYRATDRNDSRDTRKPTSLRKANPRYYAEHTVSRAMAQLGMTRTLGRNEIRSPENEPER